MRRLLAALVLFLGGAALATGLPACDALETIRTSEKVRFQYVLVDRTGASTYAWSANPGGTCASLYTATHNQPLSSYLAALNADGEATRWPRDCFSSFQILGQDARAAREDATRLFSIRRSGQDALVIDASLGNSSSSTDPDPIEIRIQPFQGQAQEVASSWGEMEIRFGQGGPVFTCDGRRDELPWATDNDSSTQSTFFAFETTGIGGDPDRALGRFQCLARNTADPNDDRLLLVLQGDLSMQF